MPDVQIGEVGPEVLATWRQVPIAFRIESVLEPELCDGGLGGIALHERPVPVPYVKDYDALDPETPEAWRKYDVSHWLFLVAVADTERVGAAAVAWRSPTLWMGEGRDDLAVLWDLRVAPAWRRQGIGHRLLHAAAAWAARQGCTELKIETQNTNVPACKFYAAQGCRLRLIWCNRYSDAAVRHEAMLFWFLPLTTAQGPR